MLQCTDFLVLTLMGCDLVLRVQWLRELRPITWDFSKLSMQFSLGVQRVILQGMSAGAIHVASKKQASRMATSSKSSCTLLMTIVSESKGQQQPNSC